MKPSLILILSLVVSPSLYAGGKQCEEAYRKAQAAASGGTSIEIVEEGKGEKKECKVTEDLTNRMRDLDGDGKADVERSDIKFYKDNKGNATGVRINVNKNKVVFKRFHANGNISSVEEFRKKKVSGGEQLIKHGKAVHYHDNGKVMGIKFFDNYREHGLTQYFSKEGVLTQEINYKYDKRHGIMKIYYDTGELKATCIYKNNKTRGKFVHYTKDGKIIEQKMMTKENSGYAGLQDCEAFPYIKKPKS